MHGDGTPGPGDLGRRIAARRHYLGWSRAQLAVRAGLSESYLTHIETHPAVVTMASLSGLADALGTTVEALLGAGPAGQNGPPGRPLGRRCANGTARRATVAVPRLGTAVVVGLKDPAAGKAQKRIPVVMKKHITPT